MRGRACVAATAAVIAIGGTVSASATEPASPPVLVPASPPTPAPPAAACATGHVEALAATPVREWPATGARVVLTAAKGAAFACTKDLATTSDHYTACGHAEADTWIFLQLADGTIGFTYAPCWRDTPG